MKRALFIITGNLSTTPRAVKAIREVSKSMKCDVVIVNRSSLWQDKDRQIIQNLGVRVMQLSLLRKPFLPWFYATVIEKGAAFFYEFFKKNLKINVFASDKSSIILCRYLAGIREVNYDIVLGHAAGALFPAYFFGKKWDIPFLFDMEDYHPGEYIAQDPENEKARRVFLLRKLIPEAAVVTYASPLIGEHLLQLVGKRNIKQHQLINNAFFSNEFKLTHNHQEHFSDKLRLVWFSQKIAAGRGLEDFLTSFDVFDGKIEFHLYGAADPEFRSSYLDNRNYVHVHEPISQLDLHGLLSQYDVGLAIENKSRDLNRDLCLTNKIWAYAQAGLYILATDTSAQQRFIDENKSIGIITSSNPDEIASVLNTILSNLEKIRSGKPKRFEYAQKMGYEQEADKLVAMVNQIVYD